ncbi:MAG: N-6 DNA methylase, partial [Bacteroidales bacterium]|nr:N-6 DNA methylase [Bacteroidales bacterium]
NEFQRAALFDVIRADMGRRGLRDRIDVEYYGKTFYDSKNGAEEGAEYRSAQVITDPEHLFSPFAKSERDVIDEYANTEGRNTTASDSQAEDASPQAEDVLTEDAERDIVERMREAEEIFEDAFGAEAEYNRFRLNDNPRELLNDPELTEDQRDAVRHYIQVNEELKRALNDSNSSETLQSDEKDLTLQHGNGSAQEHDASSAGDGNGRMTADSEPEAPQQSIADTEAYNQGYEQGIASTDYTDEELSNAIEASRSYLNEGNLDDFGRGRLEGLEYEQQRRAMEAQGVPNNAESVPNPTENAVSEGENEPEAVSNEETALSRIPVDEETQEPRFTAVDPETAWDGLVEATDGEANALPIAQQMIEDANKRLEALNKKPPTPAKPKLSGKGSPLAMRAEQKRVEDANAKAQADYQQALADAQAEAQAWSDILRVYTDRNAELRRQQEAEARSEAEAQAERERMERERRDAEARAEAERLRLEREEQEGIPDASHDTPEAARQRGTRRVGATIYHRQEPISDKIEGKEVIVDFNEKRAGHRPKGRLVVIEASQAQPSHMEGKRNGLFFIDEAQPKDRTDTESVLIEQKHAREMNPALITDSRDMVDPFRGAPTVNLRGEAIQGNHRLGALRYMYANEPEAQKRYREYLYEHAADFGFTPEQAQAIAFMEEPILVNMIDVEDKMAIELGQDTGNARETGGKDRIDADRLASIIGDKMGRFMDTLLTDDSEDGESLRSLIRRNGLGALKFLQDMGKIDDRQYGTAINKDGSLSDEGVEDIEKFIKRTFFSGESREFEEMFNALPAKGQSAILSQIWRDTKTSEADKLTPHVKEGVKAFYAMLSIPQFKDARTFKDALRAADMWRAQMEMDERGEIVSNLHRHSNFAIRFAAMLKGSTMKETRSILKQMLDWIQDTWKQGGIIDMLETESETEEDRTFEGAVRRVLDMEYEAGEASPVIPGMITKSGGEALDKGESGSSRQERNDDNLIGKEYGKNGGTDVAGHDEAGTSGERGSAGDAGGGERVEAGAEPTERGAGAADDSRRGGNDSERKDNLSKAVEVSSAERTEMASRIVDWLSDDNLSRAFGKTRDEIFEEFGNELMPIAYIPSQFISLVRPTLKDTRIYCGKGYFIDHALRNHGAAGTQVSVGDVDVSKYLNIQTVLDNPDTVKETTVDGKRTVVFIKKIGRYFAELTQVEEDGRIILHKSLFNQKKEPYAKLNDIRQKSASSEGGDSSISHADNSAPAISLESRDDAMNSERKVTNSASEKQEGEAESSRGERIASGKSKSGKSYEVVVASDERRDGVRKVKFETRGDNGKRVGVNGSLLLPVSFIESENRAFEVAQGSTNINIAGVIVDASGAVQVEMKDGSMIAVNDLPAEISEKLGIKVSGKHREERLSDAEVVGYEAHVGGLLEEYVNNGWRKKDIIKHLRSETESLKQVYLAAGYSAEEAESKAEQLIEGVIEKLTPKQVGEFTVYVENERGSLRSGVDEEGNVWETEMRNDYGFIPGVKSTDGDNIDVFLSSDTDEWNGRKVYVVDQFNPDGTFDEHKVMLGFNDKDEAFDAYLSNYETGWENGRRLEITGSNVEDFEKWTGSAKRKIKPFSEYRSVRNEDSHERGKDELHDEVRQWLGKKGLEPDESSRNAVMRYFKIGYNRAGEILNAIAEENASSRENATTPAHKEAYSITPTKYTNKSGKTTTPMYSIQFSTPPTYEQRKALAAFAREKAEGRKSRGWCSDKDTYSEWLFRSEEDARRAGEMIGNEEAVADAQPLSREEIKQAAKPTEKPERKPANSASIDDITEKQEEKPAPKGQFKVTDEMKAQEDELRKLLGIDDEEGSTDSYFRDPDELTPAQKRKVFSLGVDYAFNFLDNGVTSFPDFAKGVVGRLGSKVKPFIKSWYEGAKRVPGYGGEGYTDTADVDRFDIENFDKPSPDAIRDAEMRVAERKAKIAAEQAEKELIEERNKNRRKDDKKREADTEAIAGEAEAIAGEAEKHASLAGVRKPERKRILRDLKRIDDALDEVNSQLALLGYYEADLDAPEHEVYGLRRSAEKKAVKDAVKLAKQLVDDLGIELDKVTGKTTEQLQKSRGKNDTAVRANIASVGGDISVDLPYPDGHNLHINIGLSPTHERGVEPNRGGGAWEGDNYEVDRIMFRFGEGHNHFLPTDVTYDKMLDEIKRASRWGQPTKEAPKNEQSFPDAKDAEAVSKWLDDNSEAIWKGVDAIMADARQDETLLNTYRADNPADVRERMIGEYIDKWIAEREVEMMGEHPATVKAWFDYGQRDLIADVVDERMAKVVAEEAAKAKAEESHNGYKRGDEVMWDRNGTGKWERVKIEDFDSDGSPIFESVKGVMSEKGDWSRVKPADGVFGEAKRVATKAQADRKKSETSDPSTPEHTTEKIVEIMTGGKKPAKKKVIKPEQQVGDLFGGLFDEPENSDNNVKRESDTKGQGVAKGERAHTLGNDAPRINGGVQPRGTEPTDKSRTDDAERSDMERGTDGTAHGTDEKRGLQQSAGNRGRDEVGTSGRGAGVADERGGTSEPRPVSERETDNGGKGVSEREPASGTREGGRPASVKEKTKKPERKYTRNFRYEEGENEADSYTPKERLEANIKAIETLAEVLFGGKPATDEQKAIISRFRGWGQVDLGNYYDVDHILRSTYQSAPINRLAKAIQKLDPQGEKKLFGAIRQASLSSYYTPTKIAKAINSFLTLAGFRGGKFLDPSMGNGMFEGTLPKTLQERTEITGVELDWLSGQLSRILYPDANVIIGGFEKSGLAPGSYDVVSSNVPFGSIEVTDPTWKSDSTPVKRAAQNRIHNYYAVKMLEALRPGGLLPMMTTTAVMDTKSNQIIREHIAMEGEILGAVRLPDNTFQGTGVNTDVIFVRKWRDEEDRLTRRTDPEYQKLEQAFLSSATTTAKGKNDGKDHKVEYNGYYALHPENMIGEVQAGNQYKEDAFGLTSRMSVDEIASAMEKAIKRIVGNRRGKLFDVTRTVRESQQAVRAAYKGNGDWVSNGNLVIQDGKVGVLNAKSNEYGEETREFEGTLKHDKMLPRIKAMIDVRTAMKRLIAGQIEGENDKTLGNMRSELQKAYDAFVEKYGRLHDSDNAFILDDIDGYTMQALEKWKSGKFEGLSDIFTKNTIKSAMRFDEVKTPQDAISASLAEYGYVRPDFMSNVLGGKWADQCADFVFLNPNTEDDYVTRDEYLSGDVVTKLADAREAAKSDNRFERNVKALEEVQPTRIPFDDISVGLGARWIPDDIINDFVKEIFGLHANYSSRNRTYDPELGRYVNEMKSGVRYIPEIDSYEINIDSKELGGAADEWETPRKSAKEILKAALEDKKLVIKKRGDDDGIDEEQTELANQKIEEMRERFEQWLPSDPDRVERLEQEYNDRFNRIVKRKFNGQHLVIPGLMGMELRPHQKDAVWMLINNRGGIVDHIVGAGKTLVMQAAIMEMRRMGIAKKPMIVALKSTVSQIAREFKEGFPSARVLAPNDSDFQKENRKKFIANISLNDYDCVILSHEQYGMLPHTEEAEQGVISEQLQMLDNMIDYLYGTDQSQLTKRQIKALEVRRKNLIAKMEKRMDRKVDREFCFENLGVDYLFVDESHQFKSLPYVTSYQQIAGLADAKGSNRAVALLTGIRHLQKMHQGDKGVVFLSGTTITNSLVEIYNLLNCLRPREMQRLGMTTFDAWASIFADHTSELEAGTTGEFKMKDRFRSFKNVPELSQLYAEIADVRNDSNLKLPKPALQSNTVIVPASDAISEINREIIHMLNTRDGSYFGIHPDNPDKYPWGLVASSLSSKAAVSPRLIFPDMDDEGGKVGAVCANVKKYYDEMTDQKGVQLIFCELGVPGKEKSYDVYTDIIERLTNSGIPKSEIAYIQQATTEEKRKDLFQRVRDGKVRILIGGTKNMGTGVNVQTRITDMHMVTVPWTPSALEQCLGRGGRQGNIIARDFMGNKVRVHYYATEGSLDLYKYQLLDAKGKMFTQFKMGTVNGERTFDEGSGEEDGFDPAEMVARLSGNPVIFERAKQDKKVKKLRALRNGFERDYQRKKAKLMTLTEKKEKLERLVRLNERDVKDLEREGFVKNGKGVYPSEVMVIEGSSMYGGRRFDKPKEAGEYILELLPKGKSVTL